MRTTDVDGDSSCGRPWVLLCGPSNAEVQMASCVLCAVYHDFSSFPFSCMIRITLTIILGIPSSLAIDIDRDDPEAHTPGYFTIPTIEY